MEPQSAFLALCPSLNIPFRDNRRNVLSLIHCPGRSITEACTRLSNTAYSVSSYEVLKRSRSYISGFITMVLHTMESVASILLELWQEDRNASALLHGKVKAHTYLTESYSAVHEEEWPSFHVILPMKKPEFLDSY